MISLDFINITDFTVAAFFLIMGAIGFVVFRIEKSTDDTSFDELSEEDKAGTQKNKRIGYTVSGAQILIGLYFLLKHYGYIKGFTF